jgi:uracil-DNA glycosylase
MNPWSSIASARHDLRAGRERATTRLMSAIDSLEAVAAEVVDCRNCPRLVEWREEVARVKRPAYRDWQYWGRPVPGFGDPEARLLVLGLAPAAHGGNRTGRVFTGDRSGDWLYRALYRAGFANQALSVNRDDGLRLRGSYVTAAARCAPPANRPTIEERDNCLPYLERELRLLEGVRVFVCLGSYAYDCLSRLLELHRRPAFRHGLEVSLPDGRTVLCSFHPSQQNTFTGKLTESMLDAVFQRAAELASPVA